MKKQTKELTKEQQEILDQSYPISEDTNRLQLPRFGMLSKDIVEVSGTGKNKKIKVLEAAGTFFTERDLGETNEEGKKVWTKKFIEDESVEGIVLFHRHQLRRYDASLEKFYSTPVYDSVNQILPLFLDKQIVQRGTEKELQSKYPKLSQKGKKTSDLKRYVILYILYAGEMYQLNLSVSSGWAFDAYKKKINPSTVITTIGSVEETFGDNTYRKMTFTNKRLINGDDEFDAVKENQSKLKEVVESDSKYLASQSALQIENTKADAEFDELAETVKK